jgi:hypothetical protein
MLQLFSSFIPGSRSVDGGDCLQLAKQVNGYSNGIVALPGGASAGASPVLGLGWNEVDTVATNDDSVVLPPALPGAFVGLFNNGANTLTVFANTSNPNNNDVADLIASSSQLNSAAGASITVASPKVALLVCMKIGLWKEFLTA